MSTALFTNRFTIQITDTVRLVFQDERQGVTDLPNRIACEVVMTLPNARQLRDLLVQYVKDEETLQ